MLYNYHSNRLETADLAVILANFARINEKSLPFLLLPSHPPLFLKPALVWLRSIGEGWLFGIPTSSPAKERLQSFLEVRGLQVARFEPFGPAWSGTRAFGGVVMAETGLG